MDTYKLFEDEEIELTKVEGNVEGAPPIGTVCMFLPNPTEVEPAEVTEIWEGEEGYYVKIPKWNPDVFWNTGMLCWEDTSEETNKEMYEKIFGEKL